MFVVKLFHSPQQGTLQREPLRCRYCKDRVGRMQLERIATLQQTRSIGVRERAITCKCREIDKERRLLEKCRECRLRFGERMCRQLSKPLRRAAFARRSAQVEERATTYRALRRRIAQDKPVSGSGGRRLIKHQLNQAFPTWRDGPVAQQHDARAGLRGGM